MIIVIDGPAGSGKSSTAKALAKKHNLQFLDSGAFYRSVTYVSLLQPQFSPQQLLDWLDRQDLVFRQGESGLDIRLNGASIVDKIREVAVNEQVSKIAAQPLIRDWVNARMRAFVAEGSFIADGRDLGTVVFPKADLKIWLIAQPNVRAERRLKEMQQAGLEASYEQILRNIKERDAIDSQRDIAPLKQAKDAISIDSSQLKFDEQVSKISFYISKLLNE